MSDAAREGAGARAAPGRRLRFGALTALLLAAVTASCALTIVLGSAYSARFDVTETRRHALSPRTQKILDRLDRPHEIIVVAERRRVDERAARRVTDLLDEFERASGNLTASWIDPAGQNGRESFRTLLDRLRGLYQKDLNERIDAVQNAAEAATRLANGLTSLSDSLQGLREDIPPGARNVRRRLEDIAAGARVNARQLRESAEESRRRLDSDFSNRLPPTEESRRSLLERLRPLVTNLERVTDALGELQTAASGLFESAQQSILRDAIRRLTSMRDLAARRVDSLDRLGASKIHAVAERLRQGEAVAIVSGADATALRFESLFPGSGDGVENAQVPAWARFGGEQILATSLAAMTEPNDPIVVFVHGDANRQLSPSGEPNTREARFLLEGLIDRLRMRGMDVAEWAVGGGTERPNLNDLNPNGNRPVVWVTIGVDPTTRQGAEQMRTLSEAIAGLIEDGESLLISAQPSTLPAAGQEDPMVSFLEPLGVRVRTGKPLLRRTPGPGEAVTPDHLLRRASDAHPIGDAIDGLPVYLKWVSGIDLADAGASSAPSSDNGSNASSSDENPDPSGDVETWPILRIDDSPEIWGEAEWLQFSRRMSGRSRSATGAEPNAARDDLDGPWTVAAAVERLQPEREGLQRLVVVGANGWFFDPNVERSRRIAGRSVARFPGNVELFQGSVRWLAGQDDLIAPGPQVFQISRIRSMTDAQATSLRWALTLGPPALVLLIGAAWRLLRG